MEKAVVHCFSGRGLHAILDGLGLTAVKSFGRDPHGFLQGHDPVVIQPPYSRSNAAGHGLASADPAGMLASGGWEWGGGECGRRWARMDG
jgi:hypothetical protein